MANTSSNLVERVAKEKKELILSVLYATAKKTLIEALEQNSACDQLAAAAANFVAAYKKVDKAGMPHLRKATPNGEIDKVIDLLIEGKVGTEEYDEALDRAHDAMEDDDDDDICKCDDDCDCKEDGECEDGGCDLDLCDCEDCYSEGKQAEKDGLAECADICTPCSYAWPIARASLVVNVEYEDTNRFEVVMYHEEADTKPCVEGKLAASRKEDGKTTYYFDLWFVEEMADALCEDCLITVAKKVLSDLLPAADEIKVKIGGNEAKMSYGTHKVKRSSDYSGDRPIIRTNDNEFCLGDYKIISSAQAGKGNRNIIRKAVVFQPKDDDSVIYMTGYDKYGKLAIQALCENVEVEGLHIITKDPVQIWLGSKALKGQQPSNRLRTLRNLFGRLFRYDDMEFEQTSVELFDRDMDEEIRNHPRTWSEE